MHASNLRSATCGLLVIFSATLACGTDFDFQPQELSERLTVGYAVRLIDMNKDGKLDIVVLDSKRMIWLKNPTWQAHEIYATPQAKFDNVCFAPTDIDGDGDLDFAIGADWQFGNTRSGGSIGWLQQHADQWTYHPIANEPTTHRMRWLPSATNGPPTLIVAPLKGRGTTDPNYQEAGVRLLAFQIPPDPVNDQWPSSVITDSLHVMHNIDVVDLDGSGTPQLLTASFEGVHWLSSTNEGWKTVKLGAGDQSRPAPKRGSSEIRLGHFDNETPVIATIEPWHGDRVVVYTPTNPASVTAALWHRQELDVNLAWGHAVAFANLDDDPAEELIIGVRDNLTDAHRSGVRIYDPQKLAVGNENPGGTWTRSVIDPGGVAVEDLAVGDLDGDGRPDIVAVGRQTKNIKIYWNHTSSANN